MQTLDQIRAEVGAKEIYVTLSVDKKGAKVEQVLRKTYLKNFNAPDYEDEEPELPEPELLNKALKKRLQPPNYFG